jgi:hypothetical protein
MNSAYLWVYVGIIFVATLFNYWIVSDNKSWNSGRSSGYVSSGSWHK